MYVCLCNAVTDEQVRQCVADGATSLGDLQFELGVASCCGCCAETAASYLPGAENAAPRVHVPVPATTVVTPVVAATASCGGQCPAQSCDAHGVVRPLHQPVTSERVSTRRYPVHHVARAA